MIKLSLFSILLTLSFLPYSKAYESSKFDDVQSEGLTIKTCSKISPVCIFITSQRFFTTKDEGEFLLELKVCEQQNTIQSSHVTRLDKSENVMNCETSDDDIEFQKVDLWMQMGQHGHGSAPLVVKRKYSQTFDISHAYFVMKGEWQVRVFFRYQDQEEVVISKVKVLH